MTGTDIALAVDATRNDLFMPLVEQFQDALRGEIDPKSFFQTICVSLENDPGLMHRCTKQSLVTAAMTLVSSVMSPMITSRAATSTPTRDVTDVSFVGSRTSTRTT